MKIINTIKTNIVNSLFSAYIKDFLRGGDESCGDKTDTVFDIDNAKNYTAYFACLRVLAETFASTPIGEYKKLPNGDRERTNDTGLLDILKYEANSEQNAFQFNEYGMNQLNSTGNSISIKLYNKFGAVVGLRSVNADGLELKRNDNGELVYVIDEKEYLKKDIFHVAGVTFNGYTGVSPLEVASKALDIGVSYNTYSKKFFDNGALSSGAFTMDSFLKGDSAERVPKQMMKQYTGLKNAGKPMFLEGGTKFDPLTIKPVDSELLSSKRFQIEEVCRVFRVQLHLVQHLDKATNNNIEHQGLEFVMYTMLPWYKRWELAINTQLVTKEQRDKGYYFEYNMAGLLRGDHKSMAEAFAIGKINGWWSSNDIRRMLNENKVVGGEKYYEPLNMQPIGGK